MKFTIISADASKQDGTNKSQLLDRLPQCDDTRDASAVIIPISFFPDFRFNERLYQLRPSIKIVVMDWLEDGWDYFQNGLVTHIFGQTPLPPHLKQNPEWEKLGNWLASRGGNVLYFKRELLKPQQTDKILPIEFLCMHAAKPIQSKEEFNRRPYSVFNCFGYSHPDRLKMHARIFEAMGERGITVVTAFDQFDGMPNFGQPIWCSIFSPFWKRANLGQVLLYQEHSKISISLYGAGRKSFRDAEAPHQCVMARMRDEMAWSFPWDESNSVQMNRGAELDDLQSALAGDLYERYVSSQANLDNYRPENYISRYIMPKIQQWL